MRVLSPGLAISSPLYKLLQAPFHAPDPDAGSVADSYADASVADAAVAPTAYDVATFNDAGFPAGAVAANAAAAACVAANDPAAFDGADSNADAIDTPVAAESDAGAEAPVYAPIAANDDIPDAGAGVGAEGAAQASADADAAETDVMMLASFKIHHLLLKYVE